MIFLIPGGFAALDDQRVIIKEFFPRLNVAQGLKENTVPFLLGLQIGIAGMIDPFRGCLAAFRVDDMAVVEVKVKGVAGLIRVVRMALKRLPPGNDLAFVLQHFFTFDDGTNRVNAPAVNA